MRRGTSARTGWTLAGAFAGCVALTAAASAAVQVDCDTPDDFCTGNPCITSKSIEVTAASCVLDFGARALVLGKNVELPDNGALSLTAASIEVQRKIDGKHSGSSDPNGSDVTLIATGTITIRKRIDTSGRSSTGAILLDAGTIDLQGQLRARAKGGGATATGGAVTLQASAAVSSAKKGKIDVRGKKSNTSGGQVTISATTGISLGGRIDARGAPGGTINLACPACDVTVDAEVRVQGWRVGGGGTVSVTAGGDIDIPAGAGKVIATGNAPNAGTIVLTATNAVDANLLKANGVGVPGGTVAVTGAVVAVRNIVVNGQEGGAGGIIDLESTTGDVSILERLVARSPQGAGGTATVDSAGDVSIRNARMQGKTAGGELRVSGVGNIELGNSTNSDFQLGGTGGGIIEAAGGGDIVAKGRFEVETGGCIGLDAGGTITTTQATFDVPVTTSCP